MSNSYATVPAIIPGDLQVQGNLTVSGQKFTLGRFLQKYRIQEVSDGQFRETVNVDRLAATQDEPTYPSQCRWVQPSGAPFQLATAPAGSPMADLMVLALTPTEFQVLTTALRVGAGIPYARIITQTGNGGAFAVNLQSDFATRDDTSKSGLAYWWNASNKQLQTLTVDAAGNSMWGDLPRIFWLDHAYHSIQGPIGQQNVISKTIYGNQLGPFGAAYLRLMGSVITSSTGTAKIGFNFGAGHLDLLTFPANTNANYIFHVWLSNMGITNQQYCWWFGNYNATAVANANVGLGQDTTANQTLTYTINNSDATTQTVLDCLEAEFISRGSPL